MPSVQSRTEVTRRSRHRLGRRRGDRRARAHRPRHPRHAARSGTDARSATPSSRSTAGRTTTTIGARKKEAGATSATASRSASSRPRAAGGSSTASRTRLPTTPTTSGGSDRGSSAGGPTTTDASRYASPTTTSNPRDRDGLGWNWPIDYEDLAPYYDKAETFIGVVGSREGIRSAPDGVFHDAAAAQGARAAHPARQPEDGHPVHTRTGGRSSPARSTAGRPATTAGSAAAGA